MISYILGFILFFMVAFIVFSIKEHKCKVGHIDRGIPASYYYRTAR